jgi:hypothetical protein
MNEMDLLSRMRHEVPLGVSPRAEHLFRTALFENGNPERAVVPPPRPRRLARPGVRDLRVARRAAFAVSLAVAVAAAVLGPRRTRRAGSIPQPRTRCPADAKLAGSEAGGMDVSRPRR